MKILVAESNDAYRMMLKQILEKDDHQVTTCKDGLEALRSYAQNDDFEVIISDWDLPKLDGLELSSKIRNMDRVRDKNSYVVLTADRGGKWDIMNAMQNGANDIITKPYSEEVVHDRMETAVMYFLRVPGKEDALTTDPVAHLLEEHKILRYQGERIDELLESIDEESDEKLVKWLSGRSFVMETELHQDKEDVFSIAFLERLTRAQGEASKAISESSAEWVEKEHKELEIVVEVVRKNFADYKDALKKDNGDEEFNIMEKTGDYPAYCLKCAKKVKIAKPSLFRMDSGSYAFKGSCAECGSGVTTIIGKSIGASQKNIKLKRSLKKYLSILNEHLEREEKMYFPLAKKYLTQADNQRLMQDFEVIEKKYGVSRIGKDYHFHD